MTRPTLLFALVLLVAAIPLGAGEARFRAASEVPPGRVTVGDVADVDGPDAAALRAVDLGPAPPAGATSLMSGASVRASLLRAGFDPAAVVRELPDRLRLSGASRPVSEDEVRAAANRALAAAVRDPARAELVSLHWGAPIQMAPGPREVRVGLPRGGVGPGPVMLSVEVLREGRVTARRSLRGMVAVTRPVAVAIRSLPAGEALDEGAVAFEERTLSEATARPVTRREELTGSVLRRPVGEGTVLGVSDLTRPLLVERGDRVTLLVRRGGLEVKTAGRARTQGALGDQVIATGHDGRTEVFGRVAGPGLVEVGLTGGRS